MGVISLCAVAMGYWFSCVPHVSASDDLLSEELPLAFKVSSATHLIVNGVYVQQPGILVHGYPTFARDNALAETETPMHLYRSTKGIWVMTSSSEEDLSKDHGEFITSKAGPSPVGLKWRALIEGRWPADDTLVVADYSEEFNEILLKRGPPRVVTRTCTGGAGHASEAGYSYTDTPATFDCRTSSEYCFNDSPVYCNFNQQFLLQMTEALNETLQERSATSVVLEDELELIDGKDQTRKLKQAVQEELLVASYRVYLMEPWLGISVYIQVADAILLFSVCASYGVAAGIFFASVFDKQKEKKSA